MTIGSFAGLASLVLTLATLDAPLLASERLELDPATSRVRFTLAATGHTVEGTMRVVSGTVGFDRRGGPADGRIFVDTSSAETGNRSRDDKMHREVLESARFPRFELEVHGLRGAVATTGESRVVLEATLHFRGSPKPIAIPLLVRVEEDRLEASGSFEVPYVAWGMKDPSVFVLRVAKEVTVHLDVRGRLTPATPSSS